MNPYDIPVFFFSGCPVPNFNKSVRVADLYRNQCRPWAPKRFWSFFSFAYATEQGNNFNRAGVHSKMYVLWKLGKLSHDRLRVVVFYIWSDLSVSENEIIPRAAIFNWDNNIPCHTVKLFFRGLSAEIAKNFVHLKLCHDGMLITL